MYDVKKYNKLNKHNEMMLGGVKQWLLMNYQNITI
jgi:hypothetical protein